MQIPKQKEFNPISKTSLFCIPVFMPFIENSPITNHAKMYLILYLFVKAYRNTL